MTGVSTHPENDVRFQYDVIRNLAESVREQSKVMSGIQATQVTMLERLARIESNRVNEVVAEIRTNVEHHAAKIDKLEQERDIRDGAMGQRRAVISYWSIISTLVGIVFTVLFLLFRATGILHLPSDEKPPIIVPYRAIEGPAVRPEVPR